MATPERNCERCGGPFTEKQFFQKYCSPACRLRAWRQSRRETTPRPEAAEVTAHEPAEA